MRDAPKPTRPEKKTKMGEKEARSGMKAEEVVRARKRRMPLEGGKAEIKRQA